ncbi:MULTISPECIES: DUF4410 domain-containing protein [unclassified Cupriavidus]|uniref:DUF4410 domain-containing protein n=1 Tax=unclassified Cupriavidus TaxID=2640874 RepID=UPI00313F0083
MQTTTRLFKQARIVVLTAAAAATMLMTGCASAQTADVNRAPFAAPVHADIIYVTPFVATTGMVRLDSGMVKKVANMATGESSSDQQYQAVMQAREAVANEIVQDLRAKGLNAERLDGPVPAGVNALILTGDFDKIDEGKSRRRLLIGLGAGKSDVGASVQVLYKPADGAPVSLEHFTSNADSGHMPGVAETAGVGALAGHVAMSAAAGAGVHGASEVRHDTISADAKRLADAIARQVVTDTASNGWTRSITM